jgi:hypothetical protein
VQEMALVREQKNWTNPQEKVHWNCFVGGNNNCQTGRNRKIFDRLRVLHGKRLTKNAIQLQGDKERKLVDKLVEQGVKLTA